MPITKGVEIKYARHPQPGDYWHEMLCPVLVVLDVQNDKVVFCDKIKKVGEFHWTWNLKYTKELSREEFVRKLSYSGDPQKGLWCSVSPKYMEWAVKEWKKSINKQGGKNENPCRSS